MRISRSIAWSLFICSMICPGVVPAADKTRVSIKASVTETSYVAEYIKPPPAGGAGAWDCTELTWLEDHIEKYLTGRLSSNFQFLEFSAVTGEIPVACKDKVTTDGGNTARSGDGTGTAYTLSFRLDHASMDTEAVGFHVNLDGPDSTGETVYLQFRNDQAAGDALGDKEALNTEVKVRMSALSFEDIGMRLLKLVALPAGEAKLMHSPLLGWMMPYTRSQLCIDQGTIIKVKNQVPIPPLGAVERTYTGRALALINPGESRISQLNRPLFTEADVGQPRLNELQSADPQQVVVEKMYIIEYRAINERSACDPVIPPTDVNFGGGS